MKYLNIIPLLFLLNCASTSNVVKGTVENTIEKQQNDFIITYNTTLEKSIIDLKENDKTNILSIRNIKTGDVFQMSFYDFKILSKAYSNWRVVEGTTPIISKIEEDLTNINIIFNYIDKNNKTVLSGKIAINKKYIKTNEPNTKYYLWGALGATSIYAIIATVIILL